MKNTSYSSLVAKFYDSFLEDNIDDIEYLKQYYKDKGGSILELACGTGRILIPLLKSGIKIDGLDNSEDMLVVASKKLKMNSLQCNLYNQDMVNINIDSTYDNVLIACGSFMILNNENALKCLSSIKKILNEQGEILIDLFIPWDDIKQDKSTSFSIARDVVIGKERCIVYESFEHSIKEQTKYGTYKYEYYNDQELVKTEINSLNIRWYYEKEIEELLSSAGFNEIKILQNSPDYSKNECFIITAKKKNI